MRSRHHFSISLVVGVVLAATVRTQIPWPLLVVGAGVLGTAVDIDHFLIARARTGSWEPLRRCLSDPRMALFAQDEIFETGDVGWLTRLGSHLVITAALVVGLGSLERSLGLAAGSVLGVHIVCDVAWDLWGWRARG